jgi:SAM-dependent methyltransferase
MEEEVLFNKKQIYYKFKNFNILMTDKKYIDVVYSIDKKPFSSYPKKLIKHLSIIYDLKINSKILELGCGRGEFINEFTELGMSGYGIDVSDYAKKYCKNTEIKTIDITKNPIPYPENYFDIVFSKSFIEHFYYPEAIFKEAYRVLKPSGIFINLTPEWKYIYKSFYDDYTHRTPFTKKSLEDIYLINGFKNIKVNSFKQLPILWSNNIFIKIFFKILSELTRILVPDYYRMKNKWIRFSKELMLLSCGIK